MKITTYGTYAFAVAGILSHAEDVLSIICLVISSILGIVSIVLKVKKSLEDKKLEKSEVDEILDDVKALTDEVKNAIDKTENKK